MHVVVNHLHLRDAVSDATVQAFRAVLQPLIQAGAKAAQVAKVDETHLILLLTFATAMPIASHARLAARGCESTSGLCWPGTRNAASAR